MKRAHYLIIGALMAGACKQQSDPELAQTRSLITTLDNNNNFISDQINQVGQLLRDRCNDHRYAEKAKKWSPHADTVKNISEEMHAYLETLRTALKTRTVHELFEKAGEKEKLSEKLSIYRKAILNAWRPDSLFSDAENDDVKKAIPPMITALSQDAIQRLDPENCTTEMAYVMLDQIESDLLLTEHQIVEYAYKQTLTLDGEGFYDLFSALIGVNSLYLKAGQTLTLVAGVGRFDRSANPKVTVNGIPIKMNDGGVAEYNTIVGHHPGKHSIPVKIEYIRPDGSPSTITKDVKYEIAP